MRPAFSNSAALCSLLAFLTACGPTIPFDLATTGAVLNPVTAQNAELRSLPRPTKRIPVAVYGLPDMTGQYVEPTGNVQPLSRAVTQGGGDMLIKALQDAGERRWFTVLDRSRLDDTLKERQIVTEMRRIYRGEDQIPEAVLPPMQHAGIIIQGAITGYDSFTRTGGVGARYLGIGAHSSWQQDTVTVSLRAISTKTSEVLASVSVHKDVASVSAQSGLFRYVEIDEILEMEAGLTLNEPRMLAVQQAIEKAVVALVIEGAELDIWDFSDTALGNALIDKYRKEKYGVPISEAMLNPPAPDTVNAASVVQTKASRSAPRTAAATQAAPAAKPAAVPAPAVAAETAPAAPPAATDAEVLG